MSISLSHKHTHTLSRLLPRSRDSLRRFGVSTTRSPRGQARLISRRRALAMAHVSINPSRRVDKKEEKKKAVVVPLLFLSRKKSFFFFFFAYFISLVLSRPLRFAACPGSPLSTAAVRVSGFFSVSARVSVSRRASLSLGCETKQKQKKKHEGGKGRSTVRRPVWPLVPGKK